MGDRVLVVGGSGLIGQYVLKAIGPDAEVAIGTYFRHRRPGLLSLDASDPGQVAAVFDEVRPTVVINAAGMQGGTDACEREPELAMAYYFGNPRNLAAACRRHGSRLVHISTDYIFDGRAGPYREDAHPNPISVCGQVKWKAESYVSNVLTDSLIIRTTFVFDWDPLTETPNFIMQMIRQLRKREYFRAPVDQVGNPTLAGNLAEAIKELLAQGATGVFNLAGITRCSKYDWTVAAARCFGLNASLIRGVTTDELGQVAARPLQAGFILDKALSVLDTSLLSLPEALEVMKRRMAKGD